MNIPTDRLEHGSDNWETVKEDKKWGLFSVVHKDDGVSIKGMLVDGEWDVFVGFKKLYKGDDAGDAARAVDEHIKKYDRNRE